jgi:hypothetical protein
MLDAYIIEEIKRRERDRLQQERSRPRVEIPMDPEIDEDDSRSSPDDRPNTSRVVHIEF